MRWGETVTGVHPRGELPGCRPPPKPKFKRPGFLDIIEDILHDVPFS